MPFLVYNPDHEIAQIRSDVELSTSAAFNHDRYCTLSAMLQDWLDNVTEDDLLRLRASFDHCIDLLNQWISAKLKSLMENRYA